MNGPQMAAVGLLFGLVLGVQLASIRTVNAPAAVTAALTRDAPACPTAEDRRAEDTAAGNTDVPPPNQSDQDGGKSVSSRPTEEKPTTPPQSNYSSPVGTMMDSFKTHAMEREAHKHDRWVVDSLAFLTTFKDATTYTQLMNQSSSSSSPKLMTLVILTVKRAVPYVAVLVSMLLRGHHPALFVEKMNVHVANIERRAGRERHYVFEDLREKLGGFVHFHNWTEKYPKHADITNPYMHDQRQDYIKALRICKASKAKWCVIMEDDAVPCVDFASKFESFVDRDVFPNATFDGRDDVPLDEVAMVKLYDPFNQNMFGRPGRDVSHPDYAREEYDTDRARDWSEAGGDAAVHKVNYTIRRVGEGYGIVANAYPSRVLGDAITFLKKGQAGKPTDTSLVLDFPRRHKLQRLGTSPSLVNHLGFYSENSGTDWNVRGISTDVRFQLDDGPDASDARRRNEPAAAPRARPTRGVRRKKRGERKGGGNPA